MSIRTKLYTLFLMLGALITSSSVMAGTEVYLFNQTMGTYAPITGGTKLTSTGMEDDQNYNAIPLPFTFHYAGIASDTMSVDLNGFITMTRTAMMSYNPISGGSSNYVISAFGTDLMGRSYLSLQVDSLSNKVVAQRGMLGIHVGDTITLANFPAGTTVTSIVADTFYTSNLSTASFTGNMQFQTSEVRYEVLGSAPNRVMVIQWKNYNLFGVVADVLVNFQIRLYEGGGVPANQNIQFVYGECGNHYTMSRNVQVGLRGSATSDFQTRKTSWSSSAAGLLNSDYLTFFGASVPASGTTYNWLPTGMIHYISGYCFNDANNNCVKDPGEYPVVNQIVRMGSMMTNSNGSGYYYFAADTGSYTIDAVTPNIAYSFTCPMPLSARVDSFVTNLNIANHSNNCAYLTLDIGNSRPARCRKNTYVVNYCNEGSAVAYGVRVLVSPEPEVIFLSSAPAWNRVDTNTYTFVIDSLVPGQCGTISILDSISCSSILGQTACVEASILPVSPCIEGAPGWDSSSITVNGECDVTGDTIIFFLKNRGTGNMGSSKDYRIYEDDLLIVNGTYRLNSGELMEIKHAANGKTIRLEADQSTGHPGNSRPRNFKELCGPAPFSLHQIIPVPQDDADPWRDVECHEILASFDPNEKSSSPSGIGPDHLITANDDIEYRIDFQNLGTDTALRVEVKDSIDVRYLDIETVRPGASSHPYTFRLSNPGNLSFIFDPIALVDSATNERRSHGWVEFRIHQKPGNPEGTVIHNSAAVYFDDNTPVITNTTTHTISLNPFRTATLIPVVVSGKTIDVSAYPNPFRELLVIELRSEQIIDKAMLRIMDLNGRVILSATEFKNNKAELNGNMLPSGTYIYEVTLNNKVIGQGKIIAR